MLKLYRKLCVLLIYVPCALHLIGKQINISEKPNTCSFRFDVLHIGLQNRSKGAPDGSFLREVFVLIFQTENLILSYAFLL